MSNVYQEAREVLAKWRDGTTPGPWKRSRRGIDGGNYEEVVFPGDVSCMTRCYGGSSTLDGDNLDADFRLIIGTAGNPDLWDAFDGLLQHHAEDGVTVSAIATWVRLMAEAIVRADKEMNK